MLRPAGSALLVTLGTLFFAWGAQAQMRESCLIGPGGEDIFVKIDGHEENWPSRTLVLVESNIGNARYAIVTRVSDGARGTVRSRFLRAPDRCSNSPAPSNEPRPAPVSHPENPNNNIRKPIDFGVLGDPFQCEHDLNSPSECNKSALSKLARDGRKTLGYNGARVQIFQFVDAYTINGKKLVQSVYSNDILEIRQEGIPMGSFNAEHTWPQSHLKKNPGFESSRSDIYHLLPCEISINGKRGNFPFAECPGEPENNSGRVSELCGSRFEVPEQQKGMTARAMFYISVSYNIPIDLNQENVLREWNKKFPPTATEIERSKRVQKVQGNVNPFVDHPEWVELVSDF
jgi:deoxyribonuclease-1